MNPTLAPLFARRSIRTYANAPIAPSVVHDLLEAAMAAPSAAAKDPWDFIVVYDRTMLKRIAAGLPNGSMLATAGAGIVVCGDLQRAHDKQLSYLLQDCSAAIENILLAASMLHLGACWLGVHPREDRIAHLRSLLDIPEYIVPVSAIAVGVPGETKDARTRFRDAVVHQERW